MIYTIVIHMYNGGLWRTVNKSTITGKSMTLRRSVQYDNDESKNQGRS